MSDEVTVPRYFRSVFVRYRWIIPTLLFVAAALVLFNAADGQQDEYSRRSVFITNLLIYFLKYALIPVAVLTALAYAKSLRDYVANLFLVFIPAILLSYPFGWAGFYFLSAKWRSLLGDSSLMLIIAPILLAGLMLIAAPAFGFIICTVLKSLPEKKGNLFPYVNLIAREINFWFLSLYFLTCCFVATL